MRVDLTARQLKVGDVLLGSGKRILSAEPYYYTVAGKGKQMVSVRYLTAKGLEASGQWNANITMAVERSL